MPNNFSIAELAAAVKRREPRLGNVPDDVLVRKLLERRPELISVLKTAEPRPPLGSLSERVGGRLKEDLNLPKQAQGAATAIHEGLQNITTGGPSKLPQFFQALSQYKKPENVIGDALAAFVASQLGSRGAQSRSLPPVEAAATPRTSATTESFTDMMTRRGPGEQPAPTMAEQISQQRVLVDNLKAKYAQQRASGDSAMFRTGSELRQALDKLKTAELEQWGSAYQKTPQTLSSKGGGGANYSAEDLAALKADLEKRYGKQ